MFSGVEPVLPDLRLTNSVPVKMLELGLDNRATSGIVPGPVIPTLSAVVLVSSQLRGRTGCLPFELRRNCSIIREVKQSLGLFSLFLL